MPRKSLNIWDTFARLFLTKSFKKIAQFGHTESANFLQKHSEKVLATIAAFNFAKIEAKFCKIGEFSPNLVTLVKLVKCSQIWSHLCTI